MRTDWTRIVVAVLLSGGLFAQDTRPARSDLAAIANLGQRAAVAAVNFKQGDRAGFASARANFTSDGWNAFIRSMREFLDSNGAPLFTSTFVPSSNVIVLDEKESTVHLKIPGTLTQSNKVGKTTYRATLEVHVVRIAASGTSPVQIELLEQITCAGPSSACQ